MGRMGRMGRMGKMGKMGKMANGQQNSSPVLGEVPGGRRGLSVLSAVGHRSLDRAINQILSS